MNRWLELREKINPSKKERAVIAEIHRHGYGFGYFMITSRKFKKEMMKVYPEYCFLQTGWNDYEDNNVLAATFLDNHLVAVFYPSLKRAIKSDSSSTKDHTTEIEVMVHELSHVILNQHSEDPPLESHGSEFKKIYTEMCVKYKIRYPDGRYFIKKKEKQP